MPRKLFSEIPIEKQNRVMYTAIEEFAAYGYEMSSTNRIVSNAQISKGSLFKYFRDKKDLFYYTIDCVIQEFLADMYSRLKDFPTDLCERVIFYSTLEFEWYLNNPTKYQLIKQAFLNKNSAQELKIQERYYLRSQEIYFKLLENIESEKLRWDTEKTIHMLKWVLEGFKEDFIRKTSEQEEIQVLKEQYFLQLKESVNMLKTGLYQS